MKFISTRSNAPSLSFEEMLFKGLASDGGLYVANSLPNFDRNDISKLKKMKYEDLFFEITKHFISREIEEENYKKIINKSYQNFFHTAVAPLKQISNKHFILELFHGPTLAFKDFALQFLGNILDYFLEKRNEKIAIIGATSGDTGSAAIEGCKSCKNAKLFILHPYNKISEIQRKQMTTVDSENVFNIALEGNFDDCQMLVKKMFMEENSSNNFLNNRKIVAINSINFVRIIAQIVYYFYSALSIGVDEENPVSFVVPSGNFGDIYAGFLAKKMGLNIKKLVIATNANDILIRFLNNNDYTKSNMLETLSPSMNIQVSSNFERLLFDSYKSLKQEKELAKIMQQFEQNGSLKVSEEVLKKIRQDFDGFAATDLETIQTIQTTFKETGEVLDPHSAIGVYAAKQFFSSKNYSKENVITLATAHPAKFSEAIIKSNLTEQKLPNHLKDITSKKENFTVIKNDLESIKQFISQNTK